MTKADSIQPYLDYLDKEMSIMGVLSAFAVAAPALLIERAAGAGEGSALRELWNSRQAHLLIGCSSSLAAAFFFYKQRSQLAWIHGQLCLSLSPYSDAVPATRDLLEEANGWVTWLPYRWAFAFLFLAFIVYGVAFARPPIPDLWGVYMPGVLMIVGCFVHTRVLVAYPESDTPWRALWNTLRKWFRK